MKLVLQSIVVAAALAVAAQASATTITFDELAVGTTLSNQYSPLGVSFSPNGLSGLSGSSSSPNATWATNTDMTIVSVTGDVGGLGSPSLVSGNVLHSFAGWLNESGDPSFRISFNDVMRYVSVTFAGALDFADTRLFAYDGATLLGTVVGTNSGQFTLVILGA